MRGQKFIRMGAVLLMLLALVLPVTPAGAVAPDFGTARSDASLNTGEPSLTFMAVGPIAIFTNLQAKVGGIFNPIIAFTAGTCEGTSGFHKTANTAAYAISVINPYEALGFVPDTLGTTAANAANNTNTAIMASFSNNYGSELATTRTPGSATLEPNTAISMASTNYNTMVTALIDRSITAPDRSWIATDNTGQITRAVSEVSDSDFAPATTVLTTATSARQTRAETTTGSLVEPSYVTIANTSSSWATFGQLVTTYASADAVATVTDNANTLSTGYGDAPSAELGLSPSTAHLTNNLNSFGGNMPSGQIVAI